MARQPHPQLCPDDAGAPLVLLLRQLLLLWVLL
jgi:hypothetical protein